jgi:elongation factor Tu
MFFENDILMPGESARAYIKLLAPEYYPKSLSVGKEINMNSGGRVIGKVTILELYNEILLGGS